MSSLNKDVVHWYKSFLNLFEDLGSFSTLVTY